jgi:hypothetical protein
MKTCVRGGCKNNQFGGGYCAYHQYIRRMRGGDLFKPNTRKSTTIPKESKKRKIEHKYYTENCKDLEKEIREQNNGKIYCFFSGGEIKEYERIVWHHLKGRTGKFYVDKEFLVPCLNEYHNYYHFKSIEWLMEQFWYRDFLNRLKDKDTSLYHKELTKAIKAQLNLEL